LARVEGCVSDLSLTETEIAILFLTMDRAWRILPHG
jgi:hypothetical protein